MDLLSWWTDTSRAAACCINHKPKLHLQLTLDEKYTFTSTAVRQAQDSHSCKFACTRIPGFCKETRAILVGALVMAAGIVVFQKFAMLLMSLIVTCPSP